MELQHTCPLFMERKGGAGADLPNPLKGQAQPLSSLERLGCLWGMRTSVHPADWKDPELGSCLKGQREDR